MQGIKMRISRNPYLLPSFQRQGDLNAVLDVYRFTKGRTITGKPTVCVSISHSAARLGYTLLPGNLLEVCPSVTQLQGNLLEVCPSVTQLQGSDTHYYRETYWKCICQSLSCKARIHTITGKPTVSVSVSHSAARLGYTLLPGNLLEVYPSVTQLQGSDTHYYRETYWKCIRQSLSCKARIHTITGKPTVSVSVSHSAARLGYTLLPGNLLEVCPSVTQLQGSDTHYYRETYCVCVHQSLSCKARIHTITGKPTGSVSVSHSGGGEHGAPNSGWHLQVRSQAFHSGLLMC